MESANTSRWEQDLRAQVVWVDRLARQLVSDPEIAADVAQDAWVRVLQRPPRDTSNVARLRSWLRRVVASAAIDRARSHQRRDRREAAVARPEATGSTLDVVERAAARRHVIDAVLELDEPYRTTVLLRHLDELNTAAIAEQMGVSQPAVRKRLSRGLTMLRAKLGSDARGAGIGRWVAALLASLGLSRRASAAAAPSAAKGGVVVAQSLSTAGIVKLAATGLVVLGLAFGGWWIIDGSEDAVTRTGSADPELSAARMPSPGMPAFAVDVPVPTELPAATAMTLVSPEVDLPDATASTSEVLAPPTLTLVIVDEQGLPVADVHVRLEATFSTLLSLSSDETGRVPLPATALGAQKLLFQHDRYLVERLELDVTAELTAAEAAGEALEHIVVLHEGSVATLTVTDTRGAPVPGATVRLRDMADSTVDGTVIASPEDKLRNDLMASFGGRDIRHGSARHDGATVLEGLRPGVYQMRVWAGGFIEQERRPVEILPGVNDLGLVQLGDAVLIQGLVAGPDGPVANARVEILTDSFEYSTVRTGDDGSFRIHELRAYPTRNSVMVSHDGHSTLCLTDLAIGEASLVFELEARRPATLQLVDPRLGTPIDGPVVVTREYPGLSIIFRPHSKDHFQVQSGELVFTDLASCLTGVLLKVEGYPRAWVSREQLELARDIPLTVHLEGESLVLLVVTDVRTGELLPQAGLNFGYTRIEKGVELGSFTYHGPGGRVLFDAVAGGSPLDAQQLRLGEYADGTERVSITVLAPGYQPSERIVLMENGEAVRRGEVRVALEPDAEG